MPTVPVSLDNHSRSIHTGYAAAACRGENKFPRTTVPSHLHLALPASKKEPPHPQYCIASIIVISAITVVPCSPRLEVDVDPQYRPPGNVTSFHHVLNSRVRTLRPHRLRGSRAAVQFLLRDLQPALDVLELVLQRADVLDRHLHRAGFAVALLRGGAGHQMLERRVVVREAADATAGSRHLGRGRREQGGDLLQGVVDPVAAALLGDFVGGALRGEVGGEGFGVGDAGEVGALEDVLVVGLAGEEEGGGFGVDGGCRVLLDDETLLMQGGGDLLPSGRRGLMLGEIFGLMAGLAWEVRALFRFFPPLGLAFTSPRFPVVEPLGDGRVLPT